MKMNDSNILIYTEGGLKLGLGNIYRSLSLATEIVKRDNIDICFITSSEDYVLDIIRSQGFPVISVSKSNLLIEIVKQQPSLLLIDYLGIDEYFVKSIKEQITLKIVIIGNDTKANRYADIVVNAIIGTYFKNQCFRDEFGTLNLFGPKYLVLREEFEKRRNSYFYRGVLKHIALLFGGSDQANYTCKVTRQLLKADTNYKLSIITGRGYLYTDELAAIVNEAPRNIEISLLKNIDNVAEIYSQVDFLITSPGTALFEGLCMGIPALSFYQNKSQQEVFGDFFTTRSYHDKLNILHCIDEVYSNMVDFNERLRFLAVGEGKVEIINTIVELLK